MYLAISFCPGVSQPSPYFSGPVVGLLPTPRPRHVRVTLYIPPAIWAHSIGRVVDNSSKTSRRCRTPNSKSIGMSGWAPLQQLTNHLQNKKRAHPSLRCRGSTSIVLHPSLTTGLPDAKASKMPAARFAPPAKLDRGRGTRRDPGFKTWLLLVHLGFMVRVEGLSPQNQPSQRFVCLLIIGQRHRTWRGEKPPQPKERGTSRKGRRKEK